MEIVPAPLHTNASVNPRKPAPELEEVPKGLWCNGNTAGFYPAAFSSILNGPT